MKTFVIEQSSREALTEQRATQLLHSLQPGIQSVKLSGKSFGDGSAQVAADALRRVIPTLTHLDISDIIASRPEEEAKRTLSTISAALATCKTLCFIDLSDNALGAKGIRAVGDLLSGQTQLEQLLLCNNGLAADAGQLIASAVTKSGETRLKKLHFHNNLLETAGCIALAPIVHSSPNLVDFRFSSLRLGRDGAVHISRALQPRLAATLRALNVSDNTFGEEGAAALAEALANAPHLTVLNVRDAALGDDGVKTICRSLALGAPALENLDLSGNEMATEGARELAKLLASVRVKVLLAEDNELGNSGAVHIAKGVAGSCLEKLDVASSEIGSRGALALANAAAKVETITEVGLNGNTIGEEAVAEIEELLGEKLGSLSDNDEDEEDDDEEEEGDDDGEDDAKDGEVSELSDMVGKLAV